MRELTEEELKLAPEWAKFFHVDSYDDILFWDGNMCYTWMTELHIDSELLNHWPEKLPFKKLTRNNFDISNYKFSDLNVRLSNLSSSKVELAVEACGLEYFMTQDKKDIIAIAKALGVTAEDLK